MCVAPIVILPEPQPDGSRVGGGMGGVCLTSPLEGGAVLADKFLRGPCSDRVPGSVPAVFSAGSGHGSISVSFQCPCSHHRFRLCLFRFGIYFRSPRSSLK